MTSPGAAGYSCTMALNRDATRTLELRLLFNSDSERGTKLSPWLLLHPIPVTVGLCTLLLRLMEAETQVTAKLPATCDPNPCCSTFERPADGSPSEVSDSFGHSFGGLRLPAASLGSFDTTNLSALPPAMGEDTPSHRGRNSEAAIAVAHAGYITHEVHAYCILLQCRSVDAAAALKAELEKSDAPSSALSADYVDGTGTLKFPSEEDGGVAVTSRVPLQEACISSIRGSTVALESHGGPGGGTSSLPDSAAVCCRTTPLLRPASHQVAPSLTSPPISPGLRPAETASPRGGQSSSALEYHCSICVENSRTMPAAGSALLITLCAHAFHLACYARSNADCPLCRFSLYDLLDDTKCDICGTYEDLWACLICGATCCGRGRHQHYIQHYRDTEHSGAMQCSSGRIWNHRTRKFLHQEVAALLGDLDDDPGAGEDGADWRRAACWSATAEDDEDLLNALSESKEEAVSAFYLTQLSRLLDEQRAWVTHGEGSRSAPSATSRTARSSRGSGASSRGPAALASPAESVALVDEEVDARRKLLLEYIDGVRRIQSKEDDGLKATLRRQTSHVESLQEQILLQTHRNSGLRQQQRRLEERIEKSVATTSRTEMEKLARIGALEKQIADELGGS